MKAFCLFYPIPELSHHPLKRRVFCYNIEVVEETPMNSVELSELIDEIREIEIYRSNPQDWMNYLDSDDHYEPDHELVY